MVNLSTAQITGIVSLALVLTGVIVADNLEDSYYCEPEDNVKECYRLSSSGLTCYYWQADDLSKGDRCTGGVWKPLENSLDQQSPVGDAIKVRANGREWICASKDGFIETYTPCISGAYEGYIGEFI